jgi:hypothetical protein
MGATELLVVLQVLIPFALMAWVVVILTRAVRSLERIADAAERRAAESR